MKICGLQKLTLLDYPTKIACTVFLHGCNFRCPFCHNASLVTGKPYEEISMENFFSFLNKRKGILDGVCVTGGEPLVNKEINEFLNEIKKRGFLVKLDTNGSFPSKLKDAVKNGLVDYVAMDIKNCPERYDLSAGIKTDLNKINESIEFLKSGIIDYEFRTTVYKDAFDEYSMKKIGEWIKGAKKYFLQKFVNSGNVLGESEPLDELVILRLLEIVRNYVSNAAVRGI